MGAPEAFTATTDVGHYIGGCTVPGASGRQQPVYNPSTGKVARQVALASVDEVNAAVAAATHRHAGDPVADVVDAGEGFGCAHDRSPAGGNVAV